MNCFDCAALGHDVPAVEVVEQPARILPSVCQVAHGAAAPGHRYAVTAQSVSGGTGTATLKAATILFDVSAGQSATTPGPADLLTAAFAACVLKNVERFSHILPFSYRWASITVEAQRQDAPPRMTALHYVLKVRTDEPDQRMALLHTNIRRHGTIYNTLAAVCDVTGQIIADRDRSSIPVAGPPG